MVNAYIFKESDLWNYISWSKQRVFLHLLLESSLLPW